MYFLKKLSTKIEENLENLNLESRKTSDSLSFSDSDSGYSQSSISRISFTKKQGNNFKKSSKEFSTPSDSYESFYESVRENSEATQKITLPLLPKSVCCIKCPCCDETIFLDDRGEESLKRNHLLNSIVTNFKQKIDTNTNTLTSKNGITSSNKSQNKKDHFRCEMCEVSSRQLASVRCSQCDVNYCSTCLDSYHPNKGPLAAHELVPLAQASVKRSSSSRVLRGQRLNVTKSSSVIDTDSLRRDKNILTTPETGSSMNCSKHLSEVISMYCKTCRVSICVECQQDHLSHDMKPIGLMFKVQKVCF